MQEIRLDTQVAAIWKAKWIIGAAICLAVLATGIYERRKPPTYSARALIRVGGVWKEPIEDPFVTSQRVNSAGFLTELAARSAKSLDQTQSAVKAETLTAGPQKASYPILVAITASASTSDEAAALAQNASDLVITAHQQVFDQSMSGHRERQRRIEGALAVAPAGPDRERLLGDLDEVKSANSSTTVTQQTELIEPIVPALTPGGEMARPLAEAGLAAGILAIGLTVLASFLGAKAAAPAAAERVAAVRE